MATNNNKFVDVVGYEGEYMVNEEGVIFRKPRDIVLYNGGIHTLEEKELKGWKTSDGYVYISLYKDGSKKTYCKHRLILESFICKPDENYECNHKNGIKDDNRLENLEWVTPSENQLHAYANGLTLPRRGEKNGSCKLTKEDIESIIKEYRRGVPGFDCEGLANKYGVSAGHISTIINGNVWEHLGIEKQSKLERMKKVYQEGVTSNLFGEGHCNAKLSYEDIKVIKKEYVKGSLLFGAKPLARKYRVSPSTIKRIINNVTYCYVTE